MKRSDRIQKERTYIITEGSNFFDSGIREGALRYAREHGIVNVWIGNERTVAGVLANAKLMSKCDFAFVCHVFDEKTLCHIARKRVPCVCLRGDAPDDVVRILGKSGTVCSLDNEAVGAMAAGYFLDKKRFASFAYVSGESADNWSWWSRTRCNGFRDAVLKNGRNFFSEFRLEVSKCDPVRGRAAFAKWLEGLPRPVAILACNDQIAFQVCSYLKMEGVSVPGEVSVLGVDDDRVICNAIHGGISSISIDYSRLGYEAMAILEEEIRGEECDERVILCRPKKVIERSTTADVPIGDSFVSAALKFIDGHAKEEIGVKDVTAACGISHSFLSRRFKEVTGRTVAETIRERRMRQVCDLLATTDRSIGMISAECGFKTSAALCALFKRTFGITMNEYRDRNLAFGSFRKGK